MATGFFTDPTLCIGCKACEVACKEWNNLPADNIGLTGQSFDNTGALSANTWRHVSFIERRVRDLDQAPFQSGWLMMSDVCKHCANAGCLEACPTGSIVRTEVGSVFVQPDVCNGCGYCVVTCPFGVIDRRPGDGRAFKCTLCYDRQRGGLIPACAKACPTQSIRFGDLAELRSYADNRVAELKHRGYEDARLYTAEDTSVGGLHAFFLLLGEPETFGLPPAPQVPTIFLREAWLAALGAASAVLALVCLAFWLT